MTVPGITVVLGFANLLKTVLHCFSLQALLVMSLDIFHEAVNNLYCVCDLPRWVVSHFYFLVLHLFSFIRGFSVVYCIDLSYVVTIFV